MGAFGRAGLALVVLIVLSTTSTVFANGLGESRSYQFRSSSERQGALSTERLRLEYLGILGSGDGLGGGSGQTGNASSINVSGDNNTITVNQTNSGAQTQDHDCTDFNVTGGMHGC